MLEPLRISVVIPSASAPDVFAEVLDSVCKQNPAPWEIICVDDAMDENAHAIANRFSGLYPLKVVKNRRSGVSAARNTGAHESSGDVILFMDTDVVLKPGVLRIVDEILHQRPDCDGIVGVQSADLRFEDFFSRWKNHWMRFTYKRLRGKVHLFYTSCAAIRRETFLRSGGFDEQYRRPSIEDTVFGGVLGRMGACILPVSGFEVEHVKRYSLISVLRTDYNRSAALVKYAMRNLVHGHGTGVEKTSVPKSFIIGACSAGLAWIALIPAMIVHAAWFIPVALLLSILYVCNIPWLKYLLHEEGPVFCIKGILFLPVDVTVVDCGMMKGLWRYFLGSRY